jgi:putative mRNA 3-end processing factor
LLAEKLPAVVNEKGAILLGTNIAVDSCGDRPLRVVTHAHRDHTKYLSRSVRRSLFIIATPTTLRMLEVLGYKVPREKAIPLPYGRKFMFEEERIFLEPARHIAGSAQVIVEGPDYRVAYTGDFKMPGTPPIRDVDALVIDATYGDPFRQRRWSDWEALMALVALIEENVPKGPVWVYGYHGKLQEIIIELRRSGVDLPFYADKRTAELTRIAAEYYGFDPGEIYILVEPPMDESAVIFAHTTKKKYLRRKPGIHITLTGWEMRDVVVRTGDNSYNVSYSDHATFREILEYLRDAKPRIVIVDATRASKASLAAEYIKRLLGIRAVSLP